VLLREKWIPLPLLSNRRRRSMTWEKNCFVRQDEDVLAQIREGEAVGLGIRAAADGAGKQGVADDADGNG